VSEKLDRTQDVEQIRTGLRDLCKAHGYPNAGDTHCWDYICLLSNRLNKLEKILDIPKEEPAIKLASDTPRDAMAYLPDGAPRTAWAKGEIRSDEYNGPLGVSGGANTRVPEQPYKAVRVSQLGTCGRNGEFVPLALEKPLRYKLIQTSSDWGVWDSEEMKHVALWSLSYYPDAEKRAEEEAKRLNEDRT